MKRLASEKTRRIAFWAGNRAVTRVNFDKRTTWRDQNTVETPSDIIHTDLEVIIKVELARSFSPSVVACGRYETFVRK